MNFLQPNITFFNTSCEDLWYHQMENHYHGIFLQETNHNSSTTLGNFKNWKMNMHMIFKNNALGYGFLRFLPNTTKSVFRQNMINQDLEMVWTELKINAKRVLIGNIYIPPKKTEQIHVLDRLLEDQRDKAIMIWWTLMHEIPYGTNKSIKIIKQNGNRTTD